MSAVVSTVVTKRLTLTLLAKTAMDRTLTLAAWKGSPTSVRSEQESTETSSILRTSFLDAILSVLAESTRPCSLAKTISSRSAPPVSTETSVRTRVTFFS